MKLSPKQQRFVEEYCVDLNATQAYIRAGYTGKGAAQSASALLTNPKVADAITKQRAKVSAKTEVTREWIIEQMLYMYNQNVDGILPGAVGVASKQIENLGKIKGLYTEKLELTGKQTISFNIKTGRKK